MPAEEKVFAWIAHKDGFWHLLLANVGPSREISRDLADAARRGLTVTPYMGRQSYLAGLAGLSMHGDPEMDAKIKQIVLTSSEDTTQTRQVQGGGE